MIEKHAGKGGGAFGNRNSYKEIEFMSNGFNETVLDELMRVMKKTNIYIFCSQKQIPFYERFNRKQRRLRMAKELQHFKFGTVKRSQIKFADYNPRIIDESNQKKLIKAIKENGLIEPLVWNKRTGVLVGGHQRLTAADKIYRKKDYEVPVAIIDVDEKTEKKLNVQLNNPSMQGDWDLDELAKLSDDVSFEDMGFDKADIDFMFDGELDFDGKEKEELQPSKKETPYDDEVEDEKDKMAGLAEFNKKKADFRHKDQDDTIINFYTKVVFPSNEAKEEFYKKANIPANEEFITFDQLKRYFEKE